MKNFHTENCGIGKYTSILLRDSKYLMEKWILCHWRHYKDMHSHVETITLIYIITFYILQLVGSPKDQGVPLGNIHSNVNFAHNAKRVSFFSSKEY